MKLTVATLLLAATVAQAHYVFDSVAYGGKNTGPWEYVRKTTNYQSNGPVTNVASAQMTCYQLAAGSQGAKVLDVTAGSTIGYNAKASISHPGPTNVYMARAPGNVTQYDGSGRSFFKVYEDRPTISASGMSWPAQGKTQVQIRIPSCIQNGEYLLRMEHIGLHSAQSAGGAQLYISCAQLRVTGGTGTANPSLMSFPGAYSASDPGLMINIYYPVPKTYSNPGGRPLTC